MIQQPLSPPPRIAAIGECMIELSHPDSGCKLGFGGDTLNTALYMARLGTAVDYVTVLGDDPYSDTMLQAWRNEGIGTGLIRRDPGRLPGLYAIHTDDKGERSFHYWRDKAPARELLRGDSTEKLAAALLEFDALYFSGISLSILDEVQREALFDILKEARKRGTTIAFDPNYRPAGWSDPETARQWIDRAYKLSTIALPTLDDEQLLTPGISAQALAKKLTAFGINEIAIKMGAGGCVIKTAQSEQTIPVPITVTAIDTTAAGDSFNAAYLCARLQGSDCSEAADAAHRLAATVIVHPGAIIPRSAMPTS